MVPALSTMTDRGLAQGPKMSAMAKAILGTVIRQGPQTSRSPGHFGAGSFDERKISSILHPATPHVLDRRSRRSPQAAAAVGNRGNWARRMRIARFSLTQLLIAAVYLPMHLGLCP